MDLRRLAACQKRIDDWSKSNPEGIPNVELRLDFVDTLKRYGNLLARCWEANEITRLNEQELLDLERQLEQLHEESRLLSN